MNPISTFIVVDFPAPLAPMNPTHSPARTSNVTSRTACTRRAPRPYDAFNPFTWIRVSISDLSSCSRTNLYAPFDF